MQITVTKEMLDELAWHIKLVESLSEIEAYYINSLIKYYELKFGEKYNIILDIPCGYGRGQTFIGFHDISY
ncbi:hypothetical protein SACC_17020 [Saccharolobus caldissimus]|uniref:Uncharacterized protein n=1 Tax=Saccharolobus caldissimus TaxID=1702097 RepID=A0AAQ4CSA4_9CREN|nr:hypothetical protein SACC_17020 [Saccharolobus caldissimus]